MSKLLPPFIQDDTRGKHSRCQICNKKFHILNRSQHKCKRCFRSVCHDCAPERAKTYKQDGTTKAHRACKKCEAETRLILGYSQQGKQGKVKFGQDSDFTNLWVKRLNKQKKPYSAIMAQYSEHIAQTNESIQKFKRQSSILFEELSKSYNYSIRHFIEFARQSVQNSQVQESITRVMVSVLSKIGSLQYFPQLIYLVAFFLSFASECHSYLILTGLFQKVYPQYQTIFRPKRDNLLVHEVKAIVKLIEALIQPSQKIIMAEIKQYLDSQAHKILRTLTINFCNFQVTLHLIHQSLQKVSYLQLYKGVAALVYLSKDIIIQRVPYDQVQRYMLKNITLQDVKGQMNRFSQKQLDPSIKNNQQNPDVQNPTDQKLAALEQLSSFMQQQLSKRNQQINQSNTKWYECTKQLQSQRNHTADLKQQLCILGLRMDELHQCQQLKAKYQDSLSIIKQLQNSNRKLKNEMNEILCNHQQDKRKLQQYKYMYDGSGDLLVNLQTENELLKLKLNSKNIVFETDHLQRQIIDKNKKIIDLEGKLSSFQIRVKFLQKSIIDMQQQLLSKTSVKQVDVKTESSSENSDQMREYKQQLQLTVSTVKRQKQRLDKLNELNGLYELRTNNLEQERNNLKIQVTSLQQRLNEKIRLEQHDDQDIIQLLDQLIETEQNLLHKNTLYRIKNKVKQSKEQLKMKTLDLKLKSNKMEQYKNIMLQKQMKILEPLVVEVLEEKQLNQNITAINQKEECLLF